jgi:uncharacterized membrane protein
MKPLFVLLLAFVICIICNKIVTHQYDLPFAGQIAMGVMLLFTSIGHFKFAKGMAMMLPKAIPFKLPLVYLTGIIEMVAAISLFILPYKVITGWLLIMFFLSILPANIYAAINHVDFEKGTLDGKGANYLWFRVPLQVFFILWIYFSVIAN